MLDHHFFHSPENNITKLENKCDVLPWSSKGELYFLTILYESVYNLPLQQNGIILFTLNHDSLPLSFSTFLGELSPMSSLLSYIMILIS